MANKLVLLQTDEDFAQFKKSRLFVSNHIKLRVRFNTNQNPPRFGFIISKKTLPKVTDRNKVRRRLKNFLAKSFKQIKGADFLWFPQKTALKRKFAELETEAKGLIIQSGLWKS